MFLDASVLVAILKREPDREALLIRLGASTTKLLHSPLSRFEAIVGLARAQSGAHRASTTAGMADATAAVDRLLAALGSECLTISDSIGTEALTAAQTYGRCVGHPAALNLGDCFAYACAKSSQAPLLYKGDDFAKTDLA